MDKDKWITVNGVHINVDDRKAGEKLKLGKTDKLNKLSTNKKGSKKH